MTGGESLPVFLSSERACFEDGRAFTPGLSSGRYLFEDGRAFTPGLSSGRYLFEDGRAFTPCLSSGRYLFEDGRAFTPGLSSGRYLFEDGKEIPDRVRNDEQSGGPVSGKNAEFYLAIFSKASERLSTKFEPRYLVRTSSSAARASGVPLWRMLPS